MACSLFDPYLKTLLERLHATAEEKDSVNPAFGDPEGTERGGTAAEIANRLETAYMAVSLEAGNVLYSLARLKECKSVIEFGLSYGISTIYLAAAIHDNGGGKIISTELSEVKAKRAEENLKAAGLLSYVEIRVGDAMETLRDLNGPVDFILLDGWKNMYMPLLQQLEPTLAPSAAVIADDLDLFPGILSGYLQYVRTGKNYHSVTIPVGDGMELSIRTQ